LGAKLAKRTTHRERRRQRVLEDPFLGYPQPFHADRLLERPKCRKETLALSLLGVRD
jgi:1,6-anhydro-N-acetylmuramate kinase